MKRLTVITLASSLLLLAGCSNAEGVSDSGDTILESASSKVTNDKEKVGEVASSEVEESKSVEDLMAERESVMGRLEDALEGFYGTEEDSSEPDGSRSKPYIIGSGKFPSIEGNTTSTSGVTFPIGFTLNVYDFMRGEDAWTFLLSENQFNDPAPEGYEWVIVDVFLKLQTGSDDHAYSPVITATTVGSDGSPVPSGYFAVMNPENEFGFPDIYDEGGHDAKIATIVPIDDPDALVKLTVDYSVDLFYKMESDVE